MEKPVQQMGQQPGPSAFFAAVGIGDRTALYSSIQSGSLPAFESM